MMEILLNSFFYIQTTFLIFEPKIQWDSAQNQLASLKKILKHNLMTEDCQHAHEGDEDDHGNCSHLNIQQIKPYLHAHAIGKYFCLMIKSREIYEKPTKQKLEYMLNFKEEGNQHFKLKHYQQAAHYYYKLIIFTDYTFSELEKEQKHMQQLVQQANYNLGMRLVKMKEAKKAVEQFIQGKKAQLRKQLQNLIIGQQNVLSNFGEFEKAFEDLEKSKSFGDTTLAETVQLDGELKNATESYEEQSKSLFCQMLRNSTY